MRVSEHLKQIIYISKPTGDMCVEVVRELLIKARINNHFKEVTGVLLYDGETFLQVLEGPEDAVDAIFRKIQLDPRHCQVTAIVEREITERCFADWSMGLAKVEAEQMRSLPGLKDIASARTALKETGVARALIAAISSDEFRNRMDAAA